MAEPVILKDHSSERQIFFGRIRLGVWVVVVLILILVARMFQLQILEYNDYRTLSDKNRIQRQPMAPNRGLIKDRNGVLLADNTPSVNLTINIEYTADLEQTIAQIKDIVPLSDAQIRSFKRRLKHWPRMFDSIPILFNMREEDIASISVNLHKLPSVKIEARLIRHYPKGELMAHAVGSVRRINAEDVKTLDKNAYAGTDYIGKTGIEKFYERALLGSLGHKLVETDARGRPVRIMASATVPPMQGRTLQLHLDSKLQQVASDALGDRRGALVAVDPRSGGILALVSKPAYDANLFVAGIDPKTYAGLRDSIDLPLFNRALQGQYQPGSTLKPFIGLAGLASGIIGADYTISDPGWYRLPGSKRLYRDWNWKKNGASGHGQVNMQRAIYRSCNVYFYHLAEKLGIDRIHDYLSLFGFGMNASMDLSTARDGLLPSRDWKLGYKDQVWYPGDTLNIGIGQGDMLVTPLQLATAVAILANRGKVVAPRMLMSGARLPKSAGKQLTDIDLIPDHTWELIIESMGMVVHRGNRGYGENGTAWAYIGQDIPYKMAGKSGTAQVVGIAQGEEYDADLLSRQQRKHAWFIAFAPLQKPTIALVVLLENGGSGSVSASPVARAVIDHHLLSGDHPAPNLAGGQGADR